LADTEAAAVVEASGLACFSGSFSVGVVAGMAEAAEMAVASAGMIQAAPAAGSADSEAVTQVAEALPVTGNLIDLQPVPVE
jgi:hypothetical protein